VGSRPEGEGTTAVKGETKEDTILVSESRGEDGGDGRENDVSTEVCDYREEKRRRSHESVKRSKGEVAQIRRPVKRSKGDFVTDRRCEKLTLNHGRLQVGDGEGSLNLLVENIDETVRETPKEEAVKDRREKEGQLFEVD
jgi:hypothetical protein